MGWADRIGSLKAGKRADLLILSGESPSPVTPASVIGWLLMNLRGRDVRTVLVDGRVVVRDSRLTTIDEREAERACREEARRLWRKNGIEV